jgi:hypothetical protein
VFNPSAERTSIDTRRSGEFKAPAPDGMPMPAHYTTSEGPYAGMPPITVSPPSPGSGSAGTHEKRSVDSHSHGVVRRSLDDGAEHGKERGEKEKEREKDTASKKVQKMLQDRVRKGQQGMSTISKKIGHGVSRRRHSVSLQRTASLACACVLFCSLSAAADAARQPSFTPCSRTRRLRSTHAGTARSHR